VSKWISIFSNQGTQGLMNKPKGGNHRNMTFEQEEEFLKQFEERAKKGELLSTNEIKEAYIESVGHSIGHEQIYRVLKRHGYRKIMPNCNTNNMSIFLKELSKTYNEDIMILVCDGTAWHKSKNLEISGNIIITHIPPYTPEMNPIEQIWKQIRQMGFGNKIFRTLKAVVDRLCDTINLLTDELVKSITLREWIYSIA
jgi:transposase family protein